MSITDELRECIETAYMARGAREDLLAIADRIDAAHQKAEDEWKAKDGQSWLHGYAECRAELMEGNEVIAASLEDAGWVKLPVDADGVPIKVGDEVEFFNGNHDRVRLLALTKNGWSVNHLEWNPASLHHVQPDSWESIIADAVKNGMYDHDNERIQQKLVERCRRLAGERG